MLLLALTIMICACICASLIFQGFELGRVKAAIEGRANAAPERVRALLAEAQTGREVERIQATGELSSLLKVRASMLKRLPKVLGRAALFVGASTGFVELASGLPRGASPWLGVACLGTGLLTQAFVSSVGARVQKRAQELVSCTKTQI